jgi:RNA polymerase sigma-19 factor, ECF subfamily
VTEIAYSPLDTIYREHRSWLLDWLRNRAGCHARASDLVQETFFRLAEKPALRFNSHPRRYLATVAKRLLIDDARRKTTERCFLEAFTIQMSDAVQPGPDRVAEAVAELTAVVQLLEELPERVREAFLLSRLEGFTYREIGSRLGVSASMVKQYVARALAHCYIVAHGCPD